LAAPDALPPAPRRSLLDLVERIGNRLPEPVMIFVWLIGGLFILSTLGATLGWTASLPFRGETPPTWGELEGGRLIFRAESLLSEDNLERLFTETAKTLTGFAPLGVALTVMYGAAVAERSGFFSALIRASLRGADRRWLTPIVALIGMVSHHASDAAYLVFIPLAALLYAAVGLIDPAWTFNPLGNWWFILAIVGVFTPLIWFVTDRIIEPRLGPWRGEPDADLTAELARSAPTEAERRGLRRAGLAALVVASGFTILALWPGFTPLIDETKSGPAALQPFYTALIAGFLVLFLATGVAFGTATGVVRSHREVFSMMTEGIRDMAPYLVFAFFAAHFVAMFNWSRLGPIAAINGAHVLETLDLPAPALLLGVLGFSSGLDLFIGSATAKWSALAPVVVPMFMLLGISPEMTTATYRMGDSFTNIMTPLMAYFPLILGFCRRWDASMGVGSLLALMLPYALTFMAAGALMTGLWVVFDWPLGPGAQVSYTPPV